MTRLTLDSSCWISWLLHDSSARSIERELAQATTLIVPTTCIYEVQRFLLRSAATSKVTGGILSHLEDQVVVPLDAQIARRAAETSLTTGLGFADAVILVTARRHDSDLVTRDRDFCDLPGARVID